MKKLERVRKSRRQSKTAQNPKTDQDLFTYLPSEIILNILSRLPARTAMICKCVCKPWLNLLETPEFVKSHISKSAPGLAMYLLGEHSKPYKIVEFEDDRFYNTVFNLELPFHEPPISSVNGLLLLCKGGCHGGDIFLCNPITREYITIPSPRQPPSSKCMYRLESYGFGLSRMSCQYKVVRVFIEIPLPIPLEFKFECQVYTIETGSWRGIASGDPFCYDNNNAGEFLNGNLHWLECLGSSRRISCLDLETEVFITFSPPPPTIGYWGTFSSLSVLEDCLCVCDNPGDGIDIWLMKDYGDEKSWTKQFIIRNVDMGNHLGKLCPIKVFKDGDLLMKAGCMKLAYYSSKTKTVRKAHDVFGLETEFSGITTIFAPSFLSLKTFAMENVSSF